MGSAIFRNTAVAAMGLLFGGGLLWLALRHFNAELFARVLSSLQGVYILAACCVYWMGILLRSHRWCLLVRELRDVPWRHVTETLIVGYGFNNILPARLGELVRADYGKRRLGLSRSQLLGTIAVERVLDFSAVLGCLFCGMTIGSDGLGGKFTNAIAGISFNGALIVSVIALALLILRRRWRHQGATAGPRVVREIMAGVFSLNARTGLSALGLSFLIWLCEAGALWLIFLAVQQELTPGQTLMLLGASSLSTLIPTAPGYIGSYQLVFVMAMSAFAIPETIGLVASASIQIFLFGSVTLVALAAYTRRWMLESVRKLRAISISARSKTAHG